MTIGETIRMLRRQSGVTQEKLAEYLGITYQAISKWENNAGLPDISLVVPLANFFGVSPDILFGFTAQAEQEDVNAFLAEAALLSKDGKVREEAALWRRASWKYPKNYTCLSRLMLALYLAAVSGQKEDGRSREDMLGEALTLGERILEDCNDGEITGLVRQILVYIHADNGEHEKAEEMALSASDIHTSRQFLLRFAYERGSEEYRRINQELLVLSVHTAADIMARDLDYKSPEEKIFAVKSALALWDTLFYDGDYLFYSGTVRGLWVTLAGCYAETGEYDAAADALERAYAILCRYETLEEKEMRYTSLFQNALTYTPGDCSKTYTESERELFRMHLTQEAFNVLRGNARYEALLKQV